MEIIMTVLTSALLSAFFLASYKIGYREGKAHRDDSVRISEADREILRQYANFISYNGDERKR